MVNLIDLDNMGEVTFGEIDADHGRAALEWIDHACALARDGAVHGLVTGPINKEAARAGGLEFPGHTELLADRFGVDSDDVYTMFVVGKLRIFFLHPPPVAARRDRRAQRRPRARRDRPRGRAAEGPRRRRAARRAGRAEPARGRGRDDGRRGDRDPPARRSRPRARTASTCPARCRPTPSSTRATRAASTASSRSTTTRGTWRPRRSTSSAR